MLTTDAGLYRLSNGELPAGVVPLEVEAYTPPATLRPNPNPKMSAHNDKVGLSDFLGSALTHHAQQLHAVDYGVTQLAKAPSGTRAVRFRVVWNWFEPSYFVVGLSRYGFAWVQEPSGEKQLTSTAHPDDPF